MIVDVTDTTVTLSWISPDPPNGIITNYRVQHRRSDSNSPDYTSIDTRTNDLTYTVTGLSTNTEYNFRIRADTVVGHSQPSNVVTTLVGTLKCIINLYYEQKQKDSYFSLFMKYLFNLLVFSVAGLKYPSSNISAGIFLGVGIGGSLIPLKIALPPILNDKIFSLNLHSQWLDSKFCPPLFMYEISIRLS